MDELKDIIEGINLLILRVKNNGYKTGRISDTYHTFDELYDHRTILFLALLKQADKEKSWYSFRHSDGTMFSGMFIAGFETPDGTITYHIEDRYLPLFKEHVRCIEYAPEWDGHTPDDVLLRLVGVEHKKEIEAIIGARDE